MKDDFDDGGMGLPDDEVTDSADLLDIDTSPETDAGLDLGGGQSLGRAGGGRARASSRPRKAAGVRKRAAKRRGARKTAKKKAGARKTAKKKAGARKTAKKKAGARKTAKKKAGARKDCEEEGWSSQADAQGGP